MPWRLVAVVFSLLFTFDAHSERVTIGPEKFLMTRAEIREWKSMGSAAPAFLEEFWELRDPTPGTSENELRAEFERRVQLADELFTTSGIRGAMSDRGRIFILLGEPASSGRRKNFNFGSGSLWWLYTREQLGDLVDDDGICVYFETAGESWNLKPGPMLIRRVLDEAKGRWSMSLRLGQSAP